MANNPALLQAMLPCTFSTTAGSAASDLYLRDPATRKLVEFFERKGLAAIKQEDREERWYEDWLAYQSQNQIYASVLSPGTYSSRGCAFDLLRYARFMEVFASFSPGHGYSLQVSFLGLYSILMGSNEPLKKEAVACLESGGLFAFGVSEKEHGSDLLGNEFTIRAVGPGQFIANGKKYYIGNANCASIISILARKLDARTEGPRGRRAPFALIALRPASSKGFGNVQKIRTLGVRAAFVGSFEVKDQPLPENDIVAQGRGAWDAVLGTVTLGKYFLGFGSIGICQRAFAEAVAHLQSRQLYGKPVIAMPHIRAAVAQARARLVAMKLYAYRALDYLHAASAEEHRYLLYCAVQKARLSTEGVKVMSLLSECIGAKGFEADTYFEMALRDVQLIPGLESSSHINLGLAAHFIPQYFDHTSRNLPDPPSLGIDETTSHENPYLLQASTTATPVIAFAPVLRPYRPHKHLMNVQRFVGQIKAFRDFVRHRPEERTAVTDTQLAMALGHCMAIIAYAQLIAEGASSVSAPADLLSAIFSYLVTDLSAAAMTLGALSDLDEGERTIIERMLILPAPLPEPAA